MLLSIVKYIGFGVKLLFAYLEGRAPPLKDLRIEVVAVSADSEARASDQIKEAGVGYPVGYGLTVSQMQQLGLYIFSPRHGIDVEWPFAEPSLFVVNEEGELRMVDIANVPFFRPQLSSLVGGLRFVRGMTEDFPANGKFA
jgi:peroxiredoxin